MLTMALNIRNSETEKLATELAALTGESKTVAVTKALQERLKLIQQQSKKRHVAERLNEIAMHCASLPVLDSRTADQLLYDERGLPS